MASDIIFFSLNNILKGSVAHPFHFRLADPNLDLFNFKIPDPALKKSSQTS